MNTKYYGKSRIFPGKIKKKNKKIFFVEKPFLSRFGGFIEIFINKPFFGNIKVEYNMN